jgi:hypothetical protein
LGEGLYPNFVDPLDEFIGREEPDTVALLDRQLGHEPPLGGTKRPLLRREKHRVGEASGQALREVVQLMARTGRHRYLASDRDPVAFK